MSDTDIQNIDMDIDDLNLDFNNDDDDDLSDDEYEQEEKQDDNKTIDLNEMNKDIEDNNKEKLSEEQEKEKQHLKKYIKRVHNNFKSKLGKCPDLNKMNLQEIKEYREDMEGFCYTSSNNYIDKMYVMSNGLYETIGNMTIGNMQNLSHILNQNEDLKASFKLMILEYFNLGYQAPYMKYLYGLIMSMVSVYTLNNHKQKLQNGYKNGDKNNDKNNVNLNKNTSTEQPDNNNNDLDFLNKIKERENKDNKTHDKIKINEKYKDL